MRSRQKIFDYLILLGVAVAVYLLLSFGISGTNAGNIVFNEKDGVAALFILIGWKIRSPN